MKLKKNTIDWLFNQRNAPEAIKFLGARNLTTITACYITSDSQEDIKTYSKMVEYDTEEADEKAIEWMKEMIDKQSPVDGRYLYFRFKRWN